MFPIHKSLEFQIEFYSRNKGLLFHFNIFYASMSIWNAKKAVIRDLINKT